MGFYYPDSHYMLGGHEAHAPAITSVHTPWASKGALPAGGPAYHYGYGGPGYY